MTIRKIAIMEATTGRWRPAGEMVSEIDATGRARCQFRYSPGFLDRKDAYPLDPVSLPLRDKIFEADRKTLFDVFEDSLPDDWGRTLLVRLHQLPRGSQEPASLLVALGARGLGALSFEGDRTRRAPGNPANDPDASVADLRILLEAAERHERGEPVVQEFALLLRAGSSPGGARPKALVRDAREQTQYLAKFPSVRDQVDVVRIEQATMTLAAKAGLVPTPTRVTECAGGRPVLLVRRFDLIPQGGRRHMVSFRTLLKADGFYFCRYSDLHDIVRKYSAEPARDAERLFRQMVFNALVGNTDDHLKNFWMIYGHNEGWRLSPAFDPRHPGRRALGRMGRSWGVSGSQAVVDEVASTLSGWRAHFADAGVRDIEIDRFAEIDANLAKA